MPKVAQSKPAESVRVQIRLSPEKSAAVLASVESLGIVNLTSACNYLLNKGLEQKFIDGKCRSSGGGGGCFR